MMKCIVLIFVTSKKFSINLKDFLAKIKLSLIIPLNLAIAGLLSYLVKFAIINYTIKKQLFSYLLGKIMNFIRKSFSYLNFIFLLSSPVFSMEMLHKPQRQFAYQTFDEWYNACKLLPYFRKIKTIYLYKPLSLSQEEIKKTIGLFKDVMQNNLTQNDLWVNHDAPNNEYIQRPSFKPFTQKLELPAGSQISFHGDLHGDIHSLNDYLRDLQTKGYLDNNFKIINPDFYIVFLGDYVDRGNYGIEVIYTLLRLKIANPEHVFLVRGNHEDYELNKKMNENGFDRELLVKFKNKALIQDIAQIYDLMPVVLYVGSDTDYIQCNHGGMELGYLPNKLLSFNQKIAYEWLGGLQRFKNWSSFIPHIIQVKIYQHARVNKPEALLAFYDEIKLKNFEPENPFDIGFLWNDFIVNDQVSLAYNPGRGWIFGKDLTQRLLKVSSTDNKKVVGVFRAHQHSSSLNPMMDLMLNGPTPGVAKLWQTDQSKDQPIWNGIVATFNVTPDSAYGDGLKFNYDTYGVLTIGREFPQDWKFEIYRIDTIPQSAQ